MRIKQIRDNAWYDIPGYDGKYQINYFAKVRRVYKNGKFKILSGYVKSSNGRQVVKLNGKERVIMGLMRDTFIGEVPKGYVLYHKNGIITFEECCEYWTRGGFVDELNENCPYTKCGANVNGICEYVLERGGRQ